MEDVESLTKQVGINIHAKRKNLGLTQEELAEKVGIGQQSLSRMEKGRIAPKFERLQSFATALNCTVMDLFRPDNPSGSAIASRISDVLSGLDSRKQEMILNHIASLVQILKTDETV